MPEQIKAWKPVCCSKAYMKKQSAVEHEKHCLWNPLNKACHTCGKRKTVAKRGKQYQEVIKWQQEIYCIKTSLLIWKTG